MKKPDLADSISDMLDMNKSKVKKLVDAMDAEQLINAESAVDAEDESVLRDIMDEIKVDDEESDQLSLSEIRQEINRLGKRNIQQNKSQSDVWDLIGKLKKSEWSMIWPAIDKKVLINLLGELMDEEQDTVSKSDANKILSHAKEQLQEHVIYEGEIVQLVITHGPHNTVGIRTAQGIEMVNRDQIQPLNEHVLGMTMMPSLARIQELAGIASATESQEDRVVIPGVGTIAAEQMPRKIRLTWKDLQTKLSELDTLIQSEPMDYTHVDLVCKHVQYLMNTLCHNVQSAAAHKS